MPLAALASAAAIAAGALATGSALAATNPVISDCVAHGQLTRSYTIAQLHQGLGALTAETREYTNCQDVINRAIAAAVGGRSTPGGTGGGGSGSFLPTPVIIILVVLILAAVTFGALAIRRRRGSDAVG